MFSINFSLKMFRVVKQKGSFLLKLSIAYNNILVSIFAAALLILARTSFKGLRVALKTISFKESCSVDLNRMFLQNILSPITMFFVKKECNLPEIM